MIPGEIVFAKDSLILNAGASVTQVVVTNVSDRAVAIGSHFPFDLVNPAIQFDRSKAKDKRMDLPAGECLRIEPGQQLTVNLIPIRRKTA